MSKRSSFFAAVVAAVLVGSGFVPATTVAHAAAATTVAVGDLNLVETDVGAANVKVPFVLSAPATAPIAVRYQAWAGTASSPADFKARTGTIRFKVGAIEQGAAIKVNADTAVEGNETINVSVTSVAGATAADANGVITLTDNDANGVSATPEVSAGKPTVNEGNVGERKTQVPVRLSRPASGPVTVRFGTGCAVQNVKFKTGQVSKNVGVPVAADFSPNADYTIPNTVQVAAGAVTNPTPNTGVLVRDDDGASQAAATTVRASETAKGTQAQYPAWACNERDAYSRAPTISANGRWVAFESEAYNLVPGDTNGFQDIFVKDLWTGAIERVSVSSSGAQGNERSFNPRISPDGRYVLLQTLASNLVPASQPGAFIVWNETYIFDRVTRTLTRLVPGHDYESTVDGASWAADSRYLAISSELSLVPETDPPCPPPLSGCSPRDIFVLDRTTGAITLVTSGANGGPTIGGSPQMSADGRSVAYMSRGSDPLMPQIWVTDLDTGVSEIASVNNAGAELSGGGLAPAAPAISADGQQVAFVGRACNLGVACSPPGSGGTAYLGWDHIYVRDRTTGTTTVESYNGADPFIYHRTISVVSLSNNGRYVTFSTDDPSVTPGWTPACESLMSVLQRDRVTGTWTNVSINRSGTCPKGDVTAAYANASSADGSYVAFFSSDNDIVSRDKFLDEDVFVRRLR